MGRRDVRHASRLGFWLPVVLVVGLLAAAGVVLVVDPPAPREPAGPAAIAPPETLDLPPVSTPALVAAAAAPGTLDERKVAKALAPLLADDDLGPHVLAAVGGLEGGTAYHRGRGTAIPASTLKLLTAAAALETLGPDHTFATRVVADGDRRVVLVGGGDPLLDKRGLKRLARQTATALGSGRVRIGYDTTLFTGPDVNPRWPRSYITDGVVSPITSLWVDEGRTDGGNGRVADPALAAAELFAQALVTAGVQVAGEPKRRTAPDDAPELARLDSDPLARLVEHTVEYSDNEAAEVLARHVGLAAGEAGSFDGGVRGIVETMAALGVPTDRAAVYDGSGLSRDNRLAPDTLVALLAVVGSPQQGDLRAVLTGLPVAGFTGSLSGRFDVAGADGRGFVRAKTGTLSGVSGLAGTVTDADGNPMVFALLADRIDLVDTLDARAALDAATAALAACHCGVAGTVAP